jgi:hypothetical protein
MLKMVFKVSFLLSVFIILILLMPISLADNSTSDPNTVYGSITGHIVDKNGDAISGATVTVQDWEYQTIATTTADDKGAFTFSSIPAGHSYRITATFEANGISYKDYSKYLQVNGLQMVDQDVQFIKYPPTGMGWFTGTVQSDKYYPSLIAATVYLDNGMYTFVTQTLGSHYQFYLPEGDYVAWAEHNDNNTTYMSEKYTMHIGTDNNVSQIIYLPLTKDSIVTYHAAPSLQVNVIHGIVTQRNGLPLAGVQVTLCTVSPNGGLNGVMEATTDQAGFYSFNGVCMDTLYANYTVKFNYQFNGNDYSKQSDVFKVYYPNTLNVSHDYDKSINVDFVDTSALLLESTPSGAEIWLDGSDTGKVTPYNFTGIKSGAHAVSLQLAGYHEENFTANVIAENTTRVAKLLSSSTGNAHMKISPDDSVVYINDQYAGMGSIDLNNKPDGTYTYMVSRDGYWNNTGTFQVLPGEDINVTVDLVAVPGLSLTYISYLINNMLQAIGSIF